MRVKAKKNEKRENSEVNERIRANKSEPTTIQHSTTPE